MLLAAGALMLVAALVHGLLGDSVLRKIGRLELPPNPFGGQANTRVTLRVTWQFGTIAWAFMGLWLVAAGLTPRAGFAVGVAYLSATLLSFYSLVGLTVGLSRGGFSALFKHPGPLTLSTAAVLVCWGATSL